MDRKYKYIIIILLIVATFLAYYRILNNGFVNFDDPKYIIYNDYIKSGINLESIKWAFTSSYYFNWHPLTWLSHMLDWSLFNDNAGGHHFINLLLHIGNVLLLFLFLNRATKNIWPSAFVAAIFALHPLHVESVAWAAERKDVLSMLFGLATLYVYLLYAEKHRVYEYVGCLIFFALSLMSKPMLVTLPFMLLLLDYWPLGRWQKAWNLVQVPVGNVDVARIRKKGKRHKAEATVEKKTSQPIKDRKLIGVIVWEKTPFLMLAALSIGLTLWAQRKAIGSFERYPFAERFMNAVLSYLSYIVKFFCPVDLAVFYPYPNSFPLGQFMVAILLLLGISIAVIYTFKKAPFLFVGWFWYLGTLIPVIGLVQVGRQAMADRYTYLPSIGITIMLAWGIPLLWKREEIRKKILFPSGVAALAILAVLTWQQCGYWKNGVEIYNHALQVTQNNVLVHYNLGQMLAAEGKYEQAIPHYRAAVKINPDEDSVHYNLANALRRQGNIDEAITHYREALRINPNDIMAHNNLGVALADKGQSKEAIWHLQTAINLNPNMPYASRQQVQQLIHKLSLETYGDKKR